MKKSLSAAIIVGGLSVILAGIPSEAAFKNGDILAGFGNFYTQDASTEDMKDTDTNQDSSSVLPSDLSEKKPDIDITSWEYVLVNSQNPIGDYAPYTEYIEDIPLDSRIIDAMANFVSDARNAGVPVYISSGYRDYDTQAYLNTLQQQMGYSKEEADKIVAPAGTSEHQTGLACDITDYYREYKNDELESTDTYQWMSKHCQEYGFIVRYPKDKEEITGIIYEPWHYRYVGIEAATFIMENGLCLEEFVSLYK